MADTFYRVEDGQRVFTTQDSFVADEASREGARVTAESRGSGR